METTENNRLIVGFLKIEPKKTGDSFYLNDAPFFYCQEPTKEAVLEAYCKYAKYPTSWDWLMPVVDKINIIVGDNMDALQDDIHNAMARVDIGAACHSVVEYIKWYNDQEKCFKCEAVVTDGQTYCPQCMTHQ